MQFNPKNDDAKLVEACIAKDYTAWTILVKKYSSLISLSIANRLKKYGFSPTCEDTDDIRQNILTSIWEEEKLKDVRNRSNIAYWLSILSGNAAMAHMRRKSLGGNPKFVPMPDCEEVEAVNCETTASDKELSESIERSVGSLPPAEQLVAKLHILHGMGYRDIADMIKMPTGTVSSYIKRAKEKLRTELKDFR
jgi:RNA polymerase sigma-70 factor (ECF subfamily)